MVGLSARRRATEIGEGEFSKARNQAMLDAGMGMGKYSYIYTLAYHSWLRIHTDEGPEALELNEGDPGRAPWQADLPDATLASLQPYRERLIETYNSLSDSFELARSQKKGPLVYVE
jgi:hypothetical protein